jgi:hypothetical protein
MPDQKTTDQVPAAHRTAYQPGYSGGRLPNDRPITTLKTLTIVAALLAGGTSLALAWFVLPKRNAYTHPSRSENGSYLIPITGYRNVGSDLR